MKLSIVVASYGDDQWKLLGDNRALVSAEAQGADEVIRVHELDGTVASSRNSGGQRAEGDYLLFLDADDELAPGFVGAMKRAFEREKGRTPLLLTPAVSYRTGRINSPAKFWPECDLSAGNWMVIGTAVPRQLFLDVGGFDDRADFGAYEDWAFWIKCVQAGAVIAKVQNAVYIAHVVGGSRHRSAPRQEKLSWHYTIGHEYYPEVYDERWLRTFGRAPQARSGRRVARRR